ncbi:MAG: PaaX domain-containing protein, C- domain protein [Mycobacteriaceae bacterium]|nr:PaaX domain-containing protein, C- domain protein [Mycobacteriaceae bacterium]
MTRMTARSVVLSVLLGAHPAYASAGELIRLATDFGIKEVTLRVALTRMVGSGDLTRSADGYRLSDRLLARQRRQDQAMRPRVHPWRGYWTTAVVTSVGSDARNRAWLRNALSENRFAELREGVWLRPDNLELELMPDLAARLRILRSRDAAPAQLAGQLWDLSAWAQSGQRLLDDMATAVGMPGRFVVAAAMVRQLLVDPILPAELLPDDWPGTQLRSVYNSFVVELTELMGRRNLTHFSQPNPVELT